MSAASRFMKRGELFAATLKGTAASRWEAVVNAKINVPAFEDTMAYFQSCLQAWTKSYFLQNSWAKHFTFMHAKGSMFKHRDLRIDEYAFWEAIYLYNEIGDFLWQDLANLVEKLNENELKLAFFNGQPKPWRLQFLEAPGAPHPELMTVKEDNAAKKEVQHAETQRQKQQKRSAEGSNQGGSNKKHKKGKGKGKGKGDDKSKPKPPHELPKGTICPIHGGHLWEDCAQNPANKDRKDLDKYRSKKKPADKSAETKKEAHNVELTEQPAVEKEANVASATPQKDDTIGKSTSETENHNQNPTTEHSDIHHLDCLQLQDVENCALTVESTASLA